MSNVPPPPLQLYKKDRTMVIQDKKGVIVSYSKIKFSQQFVTSKLGDVLPSKIFQSLIGFLQKANPILMIYPLATAHETCSNYIDQTCHIPVADESLLRNYFTHTVFRNLDHGVFLICTKDTLTLLKENTFVMDFLKSHSISLSQTNWLTEKKTDVFFIY